MKLSPRLGASALVLLLVAAVLAVAVLLWREPPQNPDEVKGVRATFEGCRGALAHGQAEAALRYFPRSLDDYYARINSEEAGSAPGDTPQVDALVRASLDHCVPNRPLSGAPLADVLQRVLDRGLIDPRAIEALTIDQVVVNGGQAKADLAWEGRPLPVRLAFVKEGAEWKIDLLALLPAAELAMQVDRLMERQSAEQQIRRLVNPLPVL